MEKANTLLPQKSQQNTVMLILQCVGIIAVVFGHADIGNSDIPNPFNLVFPYYSWHMPLFIFISGYFFNRSLPIVKYSVKKVRSLLIPALCVNAICGVFSSLIKHFSIANYGKDITFKSLFITPFTTGYQFTIDVSLWFIFALFVIEIFACILDRALKGKADFILLALSFLGSVFCVFYTFYNHEATRGEYLNALLRFGYLFFFFWLGTCYRKYFEKGVKRFLNYRISVIILVLQGVFLILTNATITFNTRDMNLSKITLTNGFWVPIIAPLTATLFLLGIAYSLAPYLKKIRLLALIGRNTKYIVYYHQLIFILASFLLAVLQAKTIIPAIDGFEVARMQKSAYYAGGNPTVAFLVSIFAIFLPVLIFSKIKEKRWFVSACCYLGLIIAVILFILLVSRVI
jgi:fucose 4-O-acetylase-like acetyltransferase